MYKQLKPILAYVGGKFLLAKDIVNLIPNHLNYCEVFGGSLSVLLAKPYLKWYKCNYLKNNLFNNENIEQKLSFNEIVNDASNNLINLYLIIKKYPLQFFNNLDCLPISRYLFENIKNGNIQPRNDLEKAVFYYYRILHSFGAKGSNFANLRTGKKFKVTNEFMFKQFSERLKHVIIENKDYEYIINYYDTKDTFFYLDPPYYNVCNVSTYYENFKEENFVNLKEILDNIQGKFLLSINYCDFIKEFFKGYNFKFLKHKYTISSNSNTTQANECLISNYDFKDCKYIYI